MPVLRAGRAIAVLARHTNLSAARTPSRLELTYLQCADELTRMICEGEFPAPGAPSGPRRGAPRVGDGLIRMDKDGKVTYASPNAVSALHRLGHFGEVVDHSLSEIVTSLLDQPGLVDESLPLVLMGRAPWRSHIENHGATLSMRAVPLKTAGERTGALLLVREISELRRREQELLTKDATIREVHHRVKNNLQTVAALLRLQARRIKSSEGRDALQEAMRRVSTIALVHETLSEGFGEKVDFDDVVGRTLSLAVELASPSNSVKIRREGRFGELSAENATPLALVLTELVTNAVEHGFRDRGGTVTLIVERDGAELRTTIRDDGSGLPEEFRAGQSGLGTPDRAGPGERGDAGTHHLGTRAGGRHRRRRRGDLAQGEGEPVPGGRGGGLKALANTRCPGHPYEDAPGHAVTGRPGDDRCPASVPVDERKPVTD